MGFFDKVKNMFTEEVEEDDVKVEQIKKEVTKVAIETPVFKESTRQEEFDVEEKISKPVFFDDNDFSDLNLTKKEEIKKPELYSKSNDAYKIKEASEKKLEEKKAFKPTPIISPIYGILNKNYHKEDIVARNDSVVENTTSKSSIDAIRNKAYGTLEDELENTLFGSNSILFKKEETEKVEIKEVDDDILSNLTDDISKELDELLIKKEKYVEEDALNEKVDSLADDDLLDFIDSTLYKEEDEI